MVKIEKAQENFKLYVIQFDYKEENVKRKLQHTYRVMKLCEEIAESLKLNGEQVAIVDFIGLYHDIARFEQYTRYNTFNDLESFDHGDYAIKILEKNKFIENFTNSIKYKNIIKKAIKNHNKYEINKSLNEEEMMYAKIIRDADKLDIMYEALNMFFHSEEEKQKIETGRISKKIIDQIYDEKTILREKNFEAIDRLLVYIAFVFDFNYQYTFETIKKENYIDKIIEQFNFKNDETLKNIKKIRNKIDQYIDKKLYL